MTDLTYCYLHMTEAEIDSLDHWDDPDYWDFAISDEELQIPSYMVPPNPDDTECLPSNVHISYPYGDPTRLTHPSAQANRVIDPNSRAMYDETGGMGNNANVGMLWKDLALDVLLPRDPIKEEALRAAKARKLANGVQADGDESEDYNHDLDPEEDESVPPEEQTFEEDEEEEQAHTHSHTHTPEGSDESD